MGMHVPDMSWQEIRDAAVLAEELGDLACSRPTCT